MNKPSLIILVLEDELHKMLIYRHLRRCGFGPHEIRTLSSPSGKGSAEAWVQRTFVRETGAYRARQAQTALIVMVDADLHTVQGRLAMLDQALKDSGKPAVDRRERIARLVPKRNVETWILCLNGQTVDEETDYKRTARDWNQLVRNAAKELNQLTRSEAESGKHCIDSLSSGIHELKRLEF